MRVAGVARPFVDCNAVSPRSASAMASIISAAGGDYIDGGIIGGSPAKRSGGPESTRPASGQASWTSLMAKTLRSRTSGPGIARASVIKMCYASMTKGTNALRVAMLTAAHSLGLYDELIEELAYSQGEAFSAMESQIPGLPANAGRWIGEMEEISETFEAAGVTPQFPSWARRRYSGCWDSTPFAGESPETIDRSRTLKDTIKEVSRRLRERAGGVD